MQVGLPGCKPFDRYDEKEEEERKNGEAFRSTCDDSVVPGEDSKLIQSSNQIPPRSDVTGYEDRKSEYREGVHESPPIARASPICACIRVFEEGR